MKKQSIILALAICLCSCSRDINYNTFIKHNNSQYAYMYNHGSLKEYCATAVIIRRAVICKIDKTYYILPDSAMRAYTGNDSLFTSRKDVLLIKSRRTESCLYRNYILYKYSHFSIMEDRQIETIIKAKAVRNGLTFYEFRRKPRYMLLYIQQTRLETQNIKKHSYKYCKEYMPAIGLVYSKMDYKRILKLPEQ